jgi:ABC-type multidrug transport system permease subunit
MKPRRTIRRMDLIVAKWTFYVAIALLVAFLFLNSTALGNGVTTFFANWWR